MVILDVNAKIVGITNQASDVRLLRLALDKPITFNAGQFMSIIFDAQGEKVVKPYSIASSPFDHDTLEFSIKMGEEGTASYHLLTKNIGDSLRLKGPSGGFKVRYNGKDKVFMGAGTGVAPLRSMIYECLSKDDNVKLTLISGSRTADEILFFDEFTKLSSNHKNFTFIPVVSNTTPLFSGRKGYVQDHLGLVNVKDDDFYLCGAAVMVEESKKKLLSLGVPADRIMQEKFG